jgi:serine-type D-Ala-D-Ala carboxypeptidase/endopeptidase
MPTCPKRTRKSHGQLSIAIVLTLLRLNTLPPPSLITMMSGDRSTIRIWLSGILHIAMFAALATVGIGSTSTFAQQTPVVQGNFVGTLGPLQLKLHIAVASDGTLGGTLDSPDQGAVGIPCTDIRQDGRTLSFRVPRVRGTWKGSIENDGTTLSGTWSQGTPMPLTFHRDTVVPASKRTSVDGIWLGMLQAGSQAVRIQVTVTSDSAGQEYCSLDSLDQGEFGLACSNVEYSGKQFSFDTPAVRGRWTGELSGDDNALNGTWTQGEPLPLNFARQANRWSPPSATYSPAIAPVDAASMQRVLSRDLQPALKSGALAPETSGGITIGIVRHGVRRIFAYGTAKSDSIYEIGSITKTFTGLVLAQMIAQGLVELNEPVRALLPAGVVAKPQGSEISLLDLITQHSGLPRLPDNLARSNPGNPYADYHAADLYRFLTRRGVAKVGNPPFLYSNLGVGLLGQALANRARMTYSNLVAQEVTGPLGMQDTVVALSTEQQRRLIAGHTSDHRVAQSWDLDVLAGAGAIRSTADDMLTYLEANLHPENIVPRGASAASKIRTLPTSLALSHELRADAEPGMRIAFAWIYDPATGSYWHDGATGGYSSFAFFNPNGDYAAVVLMNTTISANGSFADLVGQHIGQRLAGQPSVSLGN